MGGTFRWLDCFELKEHMAAITGSIYGGILKGPVVLVNKNKKSYYIALFEGERTVYRFSLNVDHPNYQATRQQILKAKVGDSLFFDVDKNKNGHTKVTNPTVLFANEKKIKSSKNSGFIANNLLKLFSLISVLYLIFLSPIFLNEKIELTIFLSFLMVSIYEMLNFRSKTNESKEFC